MATSTTTSATSKTFIYKGVDKKGKKIQGEMSGGSAALVKAQLIRQGVRANNVRKKAAPLFGSSGGKKITPMDIAILTRQMATMMKAGVPLVQSFEIVSEGLENKSLQTLLLGIRDDVASGGGFAASLRKHPKYFDDLFCNLVDAGEQSGALETMLDRIAIYKEKTEQLKAKIKKAMSYPIAVVAVALIVTGILLIKVVPQFAETFSSFGADLPAFTLFVLGLSEIAQQYWLHVVVGMGVTLFIFKNARQKKQSFFATGRPSDT